MNILLIWIACAILSYVGIRVLYLIDGTSWKLETRCVILFWSLLGPVCIFVVFMVYIFVLSYHICDWLGEIDFDKEVKW